VGGKRNAGNRRRRNRSKEISVLDETHVNKQRAKVNIKIECLLLFGGKKIWDQCLVTKCHLSPPDYLSRKYRYGILKGF
jgi:hypothetical protein